MNTIITNGSGWVKETFLRLQEYSVVIFLGLIRHKIAKNVHIKEGKYIEKKLKLHFSKFMKYTVNSIIRGRDLLSSINTEACVRNKINWSKFMAALTRGTKSCNEHMILLLYILFTNCRDHLTQNSNPKN